MTKKHFITLAFEISCIEDVQCRLVAAQAVARAANQHNHRFNRNRFFAACDLPIATLPTINTN